MVGQEPLKLLILVRFQVSQLFVAYAPQSLWPVVFKRETMKSLYVGCTNNLERRLNQHNNSASGAHYTKIRRPVVLIHKETFETLKEARQREAEIKGWRRDKKFALINTH